MENSFHEAYEWGQCEFTSMDHHVFLSASVLACISVRKLYSD